MKIVKIVNTILFTKSFGMLQTRLEGMFAHLMNKDFITDLMLNVVKWKDLSLGSYTIL